MKTFVHYTRSATATKALGIVLFSGFLTGNTWDNDFEPQHFADRCQAERTRPTNDGQRSFCDKKPNFSTPAERELRVFIDPGHGGKDLGARGLSGITEKRLALQVARLIQSETEKVAHEISMPLSVRLSREDDHFLSLHERVELANVWSADLFVSIHANWSEYPQARGFEVYFLSPEASDGEARRLVQMENRTNEVPIKSDILNILTDVQNTIHIQESSYLAETFYNRLKLSHVANGKGVRQGPFTVLSGTAMPSVLVELGFVSNAKEAYQLRRQDYLKSMADAISSGIIDFAVRRRGRFTS